MVLDDVSAPRQQRSRESFARVKTATIALLQDPERTDFTLADVSSLSGVSIGSIYARVQSKAGLIRAVQSDEFDRLDRTVREIAGLVSTEATFPDAVAGAVRALVDHLVDNAAILRAFMRLSATDEQLAQRGMASSDVAEAVFTNAVLDAGARWNVRVSFSDAAWCYDLIYSVIGRHLGLGIAGGGFPRDHVPPSELADRLAYTIRSLLISNGKSVQKESP